MFKALHLVLTLSIRRRPRWRLASPARGFFRGQYRDLTDLAPARAPAPTVRIRTGLVGAPCDLSRPNVHRSLNALRVRGSPWALVAIASVGQEHPKTYAKVHFWTEHFNAADLSVDRLTEHLVPQRTRHERGHSFKSQIAMQRSISAAGGSPPNSVLKRVSEHQSTDSVHAARQTHSSR